MSKGRKSSNQKNIDRRTNAFGDDCSKIYNVSERQKDDQLVGWTQLPRLVPLLGYLGNKMSEKGKAVNSVYSVLWAHHHGDSYVKVNSTVALAFEAGLQGQEARASRSWNDRVAQLKKLKFIDTAKVGMNPHAQILLYNPHIVAKRIKEEVNQENFDESIYYDGFKKWFEEHWWSSYQQRCFDVGVETT